MKKVFLSLGFKGKTEEQVNNEIEKAKKRIAAYYECGEDLEFVNVEFIHNYDYVGVNRVECLGEAIKKMSRCDKVYFINDWFNYNGCSIEKEICELYDISHETVIV